MLRCLLTRNRKSMEILRNIRHHRPFVWFRDIANIRDFEQLRDIKVPFREGECQFRTCVRI